MKIDENVTFLAGQLLELHRMIVNETDESPEGEAIRDSMDHPWDRLDKEQSKALTHVSEFLYELTPLELTNILNGKELLFYLGYRDR